MPSDPFRTARDEKRVAALAWMSIASPLVVEIAGQAGFDAVLIDQQHGVAGKREMLSCLTAARAAGLSALVRVAMNDGALIGQALDGGAQGVVCPMVNSAADAARLVSAVKYPPLGKRSYGPYAGKFLFEGDYFKQAGDWTIACAQIETAEAMAALDEILATDGLDMILVGPNDLAISLSDGQSRDINAPAVVEALDLILARCRAHNVVASVFANSADYAKPLLTKGWDVVTVGTDASVLAAGFADIVKAVSGSRS